MTMIVNYKNYIFVNCNIDSFVRSDVSDGYLTFGNGERIKLPHKNYELLGCVGELFDAPYSKDFYEAVFGTESERDKIYKELNLNKTDLILKA